MKKFTMILVITVFSVVLAGNALAIPVVGGLAVDFRMDAWAGANNQPYWTVGGVTAIARPPVLPQLLLYQDNVDGLGVLGGEPDEVDNAERLQVEFGGGMLLSGVWITDLFARTDGAHNVYGEWGSVLINDRDKYYFEGRNSDQGNGEQYVNFGSALLVKKAYFQIEGGTNNNDFSVAGFTAAVPEPATMLLLGLGLVGLAGIRRKL